MRTDLFDFDLPEDRIALRPTEPRDSARLMVVGSDGSIRHRHFYELPDLLQQGDILAFNDSRVISARLTGSRPSRQPDGAPVAVEITLHLRLDTDRYKAFVQPAKRLRAGDRLALAPGFWALVLGREGREVELAFEGGQGSLRGHELDTAIAVAGQMPLPPYIARQRPPDARDLADYQTVYAVHNGSVAAPTAGLHFTDGLLDRLAQAGVDRAMMTLHVGAGTFLPVSVEDTESHIMHAERAILDFQTASRLNAARAAGGRIGAVGTTALRTLESAAAEDGQIHAFDADTRIFITPGYRFKSVDMLLTNFHLPRSTLFMLVCAFAGIDVMQKAYSEAIQENYRFYSYGDACLLFRPS